MPIYDYICDNCEHKLSVHQQIKYFKLLKKCPQCKKNALYRDYSESNIYFKDDVPKTLGSLAEKRSDKNKLEIEDRRRADKKETLQMRFAPHVEKGHMDVDQANSMIEKALDAPRNTSLELNRKVKKEISTGTKAEKQKKITNYIEKGKTE